MTSADQDEPFSFHAASAVHDLQTRMAELDSRARL
jgi:hypothetical protein